MEVALTNEEVRKSAKLFYTNPHSGERLDNKNAEYSFADVSQFVPQFTNADVLLITTMPSGLGLDFHSEKDGTIWIEFYGDVLQGTFVDLATAQNILERAFNSTSSKPVCEIFPDLVQKWEY
jgi:hypothetical protein